QLTEVEPGRVWENDRWQVFRFPSRDNPGLEPDEVERLGIQFSAKMRSQELDAEFVDWSGAVFPGWALDKALENGSSHSRQFMPHHPVVVGCDAAAQVGGDYSVLVALCLRCRAVVDIWRDHRAPLVVLYEKVGAFCGKWKAERLRYDQTTLGGIAVGVEFE